jgi:hypothetical protein
MEQFGIINEPNPSNPADITAQSPHRDHRCDGRLRRRAHGQPLDS